MPLTHHNLQPTFSSMLFVLHDEHPNLPHLLYLDMHQPDTYPKNYHSHNSSKDLSHYLPRCLYTRTYCPVLSPYASFGKLPVDSFLLLYTCGISPSVSHRYCVLSDLYTLWYYSCSIRTGSVRLHNRYLPVWNVQSQGYSNVPWDNTAG